MGFVALATNYHASREATLRRYAEISPDPVAAVYFSWKLKPTQKGRIGNPNQPNLFGVSAEDEVREALRLRIEYSIASESFRASGLFLPKDKSVENDGPIYRAAATGLPVDDEVDLNLGQASGRYALPLWTPDDQLGAAGENSVAVLLRPVATRNRPKKSVGNDVRGLFGRIPVPVTAAGRMLAALKLFARVTVVRRLPTGARERLRTFFR